MQFDQDGHSEVQHQLLITLVHGTWGRGFLPKLQRPNRRPFWFEEGGPFLARLGTELRDIPHKIKPLLWSGANSIFERDKAAHALAEYLAAEHAEHPQATQLIIAHSHGGNIALGALHHLKQRDGSPSYAESANPFVVTMATPFVEVHQADLGDRPEYVRMAVFFAVQLLLFVFLELGLFLGLKPLWGFLRAVLGEFFLKATFAMIGVVIFCGYVFSFRWLHWWLREMDPARRNRVQALNEATQLGKPASTQRLLVIRAIDDEASLVLALGTILNYLTTTSILTIFFLFSLFLLVNGPFLSVTQRLGWRLSPVIDLFLQEVFKLVAVGWVILTPLLFGILMVFRSAHGRELAVSPMECQINTQSTPDGVGTKIVTLVRHTYAKSLRHGIYDHEDCAKTISDWVRFRLKTN